MVEAWYYDEDVGTIRFFGMDRQGRPRGITACNKPTLAKYVVDEVCNELLRPTAIIPYRPQEELKIEENTEANLSEVVHEGEEDIHTDGVRMEELDLAPAKLDDLRADVQDPLKEVNLGTEAEPRITFVSGLLPPEMRDKIICLLHEFKDYFAWDYSEMPGLDRELVEHRLPINKGYKPYKQPPRRMSPEVILKVKEEVERLHKVGFIRTARYSEWLSNIVPVLKKNGKLRVCIDFRNLNLATPKDEYLMPVADLLVDGVARHRILSFMDGHSGYNQIFIAEEDIRATYQRAMNAIFHDMIGRFMEIYIDDVVVKSMEDKEHLEHLRKAFERMRQHGHSFIIVATDYFTKWVEARPMKKVEQGDVIKFIKEDLIQRFGLPETITSDQGTAFVGSQVKAFAKDMGFHLLNSTPHYAQANGQAEASNKIIINILEKMVDDNPRRWHELLSDTLWAYRTSQRSSTKVTPFSLTYGHDAVLPMELTARSLRIAIQNGLNSGEYNEAMIMELEDLEEARLTALDVMKAQKLKVARAYNKRVKQKNLAEGTLVWKAMLPLGKKDPRYGKWSPNWEGPFQIHKVLKGGAYWLKSLNGELHPCKINGIYLKPYYPTVWEAKDSSASTSA
ncbi:hypothetical protein SLEP1_g18971 [Rubroshorea leprosula]|uniref:Integrase catalytic domain-containing protein n=1 Tax=Rubroshorea leprosula TaxID=152421 RepID=A0AAV5J864_9ROSI|nr:hypothetical protein SLEP1_g18971 [Rubroshorea leprosula]